MIKLDSGELFLHSCENTRYREIVDNVNMWILLLWILLLLLCQKIWRHFLPTICSLPCLRMFTRKSPWFFTWFCAHVSFLLSICISQWLLFTFFGNRPSAYNSHLSPPYLNSLSINGNKCTSLSRREGVKGWKCSHVSKMGRYRDDGCHISHDIFLKKQNNSFPLN